MWHKNSLIYKYHTNQIELNLTRKLNKFDIFHSLQGILKKININVAV
jgi:hypothetical protein